ncbi:MAG TPA: DUF4491 family protein [Calditrichaeota bacterium]|nr:DUF4491 family protein [Calditrichota bacterium]
MNYTGIILGLVTLLVIGIGFVWVVKLEYHIGACCARVVLFLGLFLMALTIFIDGFWACALVGIFAGSVIWGASELLPQEMRVAQGMFRDNPNKLCAKLKKARLARFQNRKRRT